MIKARLNGEVLELEAFALGEHIAGKILVDMVRPLLRQLPREEVAEVLAGIVSETTALLCAVGGDAAMLALLSSIKASIEMVPTETMRDATKQEVH